MSKTDKTYIMTEEKYQEGLEKGWNEDDMPKPGTYKGRRSRHIVPRNEQKVKITMYIDAEILDFFKERAKQPNASPYQTQINNELRGVMERSSQKDEVITVSMLNDPAFISALAEKLKAA